MYKAIQRCPLCIATNYCKRYDAVVHAKPKTTFAGSQKLVFLPLKVQFTCFQFLYKNDCSPYCSSL